MDRLIKKKMEEEVLTRLEEEAAMDADDPARKDAVENLVKLYQLYDKRENDEKKWERWVKVGVEIFLGILPLAVYGIWFKMGLDFEKNGAFTSSMFKNLMSIMKPKR